MAYNSNDIPEALLAARKALHIGKIEDVIEARDAIDNALRDAEKRKPLTQKEVAEGFCKHQDIDIQLLTVFNAGVRFAESAHGIKGSV